MLRSRYLHNLLVGFCLAACGCASGPKARYVYQDGEYGVIGIPYNTFLDKTNYLGQAEALMARHFPEGHEVIRAEEVIEGQRTLDVGTKTEITAAPNVRALDQVIRIGTVGGSRSYEEKDQLQLRECRIIYRRKAARTLAGSSEFAAVASLSPQFYVDPNAVLRRQAANPALVKASATPKLPGEAITAAIVAHSTN